MTYYGKQRMESFKRAFFASRLNEKPDTAGEKQVQPSYLDSHAIRIPGFLTGAGMGAGQLAS